MALKKPVTARCHDDGATPPANPHLLSTDGLIPSTPGEGAVRCAVSPSVGAVCCAVSPSVCCEVSPSVGAVRCAVSPSVCCEVSPSVGAVRCDP